MFENFYTIVWFLLIIFFFASKWIVYKKANKPGWAALIPIYSFMILLEICGEDRDLILFFFIPIVNVIMYYKYHIVLAESFQKTKLFGIGLFLFPFAYFPLLAFDGSNDYIKPF